MNAIKSYKRFLAVGCSHGALVDPTAVDAVLHAKDRWKPDFTAHLGDFVDMTAFRSGARGTPDESKSTQPDFDAGIKFLKQLRPNVVLCGNHEDRLWAMQAHPNAIVSDLAGIIVRDIHRACDEMKARLIPWEYKAFFPLGDFKLIHGTVFGENAIRDHAEMWGNVIHAHTHRAGTARGRRIDNPQGVCVGTLTRAQDMLYAKPRRATLSWSQGIAFGLYNDKKAHVWLCERGQEEKDWVFPL